MIEPRRIAAIRERLLDWYRKNRRDLPWRRTRDPYCIWVAETMLQQTQVSTVVPYYHRFLERFPDVDSLADATEEALLAAWSGLGYYSRARNLKSAARAVRERFGGEVPADYDAFRGLPGVGPYTAGAVLSIAFGKPLPIVDGNVARVLSRVFALGGDPRKRKTRERLWELALKLVPEDAASDFNQGMMELGALVCAPRSPACLLCPLNSLCEAHRSGREEAFPETARRKPSRAVEAAAAVHRDARGRVLLARRVGAPLLRGLWEFPTVSPLSGPDPRRGLAAELSRRFACEFEIGEELFEVRHSILERRIRVRVFLATRRRGSRLHGCEDARLVEPAAWQSLPLTASARKIFAALASRDMAARSTETRLQRRTATKQR